MKFAFTLVELLVVIAIIATLAAILFPVLSRAREAAKKAGCLSNSRQLTLGVVMYSSDVDDVLPPVASAANYPVWVDLVQPYIRDVRVRVCPDDLGDSQSYGLNSLVFVDLFGLPPGPMPALSTMSQFAFPSETVMVAELGAKDDLISPLPNTYKVVVPDDQINDVYDARPIFRHFSRNNLGFFDGHAESRLKEQFYVGWTPPDYWFCVDRSNLASCQTAMGQ
jgi:prepilin-type N-terminal cleavage/methylation domain-containing protein/prepilin-type processing-associated H-X9-DG protein